jgi:hypothetical protein
VKASALGNHVSHVVRICSQEKVIWVNALSVVASVQNQHPLWNFCIVCPFPSVTVGKSAPLSNTEVAVAVSV